MPERGSFKDQCARFADVFPFFVRLKSEKKYMRQFKDLNHLLVELLKAVFGKSKGKG